MKVEAPDIEVLTALGDYLQRTIKSPKYKAPVIGWPDSSKPLIMPAMSLVVKSSILTMHEPYLLSMHNVQSGVGVKAPGSDNIYDCGEWAYTVQLDLWLKTDAERNDAKVSIAEAFFSSEERVTPAIRLKLKNYFDSTAVFIFLNSSTPDSATTAITQEFRILVDISCTCPHLVRRENERLITDINLLAEFEET